MMECGEWLSPLTGGWKIGADVSSIEFWRLGAGRACGSAGYMSGGRAIIRWNSANRKLCVSGSAAGFCWPVYGTNAGGWGMELPVPCSWTKFSTSFSGSS